jgi:hypothetical protein
VRRGAGDAGDAGSEAEELLEIDASGGAGGFCFVAKSKGRSCNEQTSRVVIPAERRRAQKS